MEACIIEAKIIGKKVGDFLSWVIRYWGSLRRQILGHECFNEKVQVRTQIPAGQLMKHARIGHFV